MGIPVPRLSFDRIVQPGKDGGLVLFDSSWANETVEGTVSPPDDPDRPRSAAAPEETQEQFVERARREGWDGPIFSCPGCKGINPCGMLVCVHCRSPFLFRLREYPDYLVSPMAQKIISQVVEKSCPQLQVPNPVRRDTSEVARAVRFGQFTGQLSSAHILRLKITNYFKWQRRWYPESSNYMGEARFSQFSDMGYTPLLPRRCLPGPQGERSAP